MFTALARRFTKDERGKRKKKAHGTVNRGRESRNEKGEEKCLACAIVNKRSEGEKFHREGPTATFLICSLSARKCVLHLLSADFLEP